MTYLVGKGLKTFSTTTTFGGGQELHNVTHNLDSLKIVKVVVIEDSHSSGYPMIAPDYFHYWNGNGGPAYNAMYNFGVTDNNNIGIYTYWLSGTYTIKVYAV